MIVPKTKIKEWQELQEELAAHYKTPQREDALTISPNGIVILFNGVGKKKRYKGFIRTRVDVGQCHDAMIDVAYVQENKLMFSRQYLEKGKRIYIERKTK